MKKSILYVLVVLVFMIPLSGKTAATGGIYLTGGNLLDVAQGKIIANALVVIEGHAIKYAGPEKVFETLPGGVVIDCSGKTILPGLFDAHIHLGGACTLGYIHLDEARKLNAFLFSGVTSVFDLGAVPDSIFSLREAEKKNMIVSPRIFAVGPVFTSPKGHGTEYGVPMSETPTTEVEAQEAVRKIIKTAPEYIKIIYEKGSKRFTSLNYDLMEVIIDEAHKNKFPVVTHVITLEQARDAVKAGTDGLAHMVTDKEIPVDFLAEMKQKGVFCIPTLAVFESFSGGIFEIAKGLDERLANQGICREIIADLSKKTEIPGIQKRFKAKNRILDIAMLNVKKMSEHGIKIAVGTDAGNPAVFFGPSVHREMALMVEAGISEAEVIKAATLNPAEILGQGSRLGTVAKGKLADIVVVDDNPLDDIHNTQRIHIVIKNGEILDREELARTINPSQRTRTIPVNETKKVSEVNSMPVADIDPTVRKQIVAAKKLLKNGVDAWDPEPMKRSRDRFLGLMARENRESFYALYYIALCDYRLATNYLSLNQMDKAKPYIKEGQTYLKKGMDMDPDFGELDALYASMLGFEIAINPEESMSLGFQIYQYFGKALEKSPGNPRVHYLKGVSDLYTPVEYGGGADTAIKTLTKSLGLFEQEKIEDPVLPSWGKEEVYTFLGMAYNQKADRDKAIEFFNKALEINPVFMLAKHELEKIKE